MGFHEAEGTPTNSQVMDEKCCPDCARLRVKYEKLVVELDTVKKERDEHRATLDWVVESSKPILNRFRLPPTADTNYFSQTSK